MSADEIRAYAPEFRPTIELAVVAVPDHLWITGGAGLPPLLPMHPWQRDHVLDAHPELRPTGETDPGPAADVAAHRRARRRPAVAPEDLGRRADDLGRPDRLPGRRSTTARSCPRCSPICAGTSRSTCSPRSPPVRCSSTAGGDPCAASPSCSGPRPVLRPGEVADAVRRAVGALDPGIRPGVPDRGRRRSIRPRVLRAPDLARAAAAAAPAAPRRRAGGTRAEHAGRAPRSAGRSGSPTATWAACAFSPADGSPRPASSRPTCTATWPPTTRTRCARNSSPPFCPPWSPSSSRRWSGEYGTDPDQLWHRVADSHQHAHTRSCRRRPAGDEAAMLGADAPDQGDDRDAAVAAAPGGHLDADREPDGRPMTDAGSDASRGRPSARRRRGRAPAARRPPIGEGLAAHRRPARTRHALRPGRVRPCPVTDPPGRDSSPTWIGVERSRAARPNSTTRSANLTIAYDRRRDIDGAVAQAGRRPWRRRRLRR